MPATTAAKNDLPLLAKYPPLFQNRNFLLLWGGAIVSALGDRIHMVVMLALVSQLMGRMLHRPHYEAGTMENAQLTVAMLSPFLLFGPFTGMLADRLPRQLIMIGSDLVRVVIVIVARTIFLGEQGTMADASLYALLLGSEFILATFAATFSPARLALLPQLVHPDQLLRANSLTSAAGTIASLLGFVLGGALVAWNLSGAMYIDAGTFLGSAIFLAFLRVPQRATMAAVQPKSKSRGVIRDLVQGMEYMRQHRRVLQITLLLLVFWSCGAIILNGLTGIVTHYYGLSISQYANFMGVIGVGMILGAASVSLFRHGIPKEIGIAWAMVGVGISLFAFSFMTHWLPGMIFVTLAAACGSVLLVSLDTLLQRIVPNYVRGRVMGAKDMITTLGLVGLTLPLAFWKDVDSFIRFVLMCLSLFVICVGTGLVMYYYRRQPLRTDAAIAMRFTRGFLAVWHRFHRVGPCRIPGQGPVIVVANHSSAMDPVVLQASSPRRIIHFMMAKEYYQKKPFYWLFKAFGTIPVNRSGTDIASIRTAVRTLAGGQVIGLFPEGKISMDGELQEARNGVAAIVLMSNATVVPAYIHGTSGFKGMVKDFLIRTRLRLYYGRPLRFDQYAGKDRDKETMQRVTDEIMAAIRALRDKARGVAPVSEDPPKTMEDRRTKIDSAIVASLMPKAEYSPPDTTSR